VAKSPLLGTVAVHQPQRQEQLHLAALGGKKNIGYRLAFMALSEKWGVYIYIVWSS